MLALTFHIWFLIQYIIIKIDTVYEITQWKVVRNNCHTSIPEIDTIYKYHFINYICQLLNLIHHTSCVGNVRWFYFNEKLKEYKFAILCQIHNINKEKLRKFMLKSLCLYFNWYIIFGEFFYNFENQFCLVF